MLRRLPEGQELWLVKGTAIDVIADYRALEAKLGDTSFELCDGGS